MTVTATVKNSESAIGHLAPVAVVPTAMGIMAGKFNSEGVRKTEQRGLAVSEALHPSINAAGWRQCRRQTGFSQLTSPQHNPQEWVISLNATLNTEAETHRHSHLRCTASCAKIVSVVADRGVIVLDAPPRRFTAAAARKKWEPGCLRACACCAVSPRAPDAGGAQAGRAWCDVARLCQGTGGGVTGTPI